MTYEYGREDVTCAMEKSGDLMIVQMEIAIVEVIIACHRIITVYLTTGDQR
jgi:hypothetical protein